MKQLLFVFVFAANFLYSQSCFTTHQAADLMISGVDFNNTGGALRFNHPNGLATNGTNLLMCDRFNNRVLVWYMAPTAWHTPPDLVLGQPDFVANNPGTSKSEMNWPGNVSVAPNGKLAVADTNNDRILLWNSFPTTHGQAADRSINLRTMSPAGLPLRWGWPWGVWTDGTRLAVVATTGATILFWNSFPTADDQQPDYTLTNAHFGTPRNISTDGFTYFFVGDHNATVNGVPGTFFWNSYPTSANSNYDFYRNEWIKGTHLANTGELIASGLSHIYTWQSIPTQAAQHPQRSASPACYDNGDGVDVVEANGRIYVCNYNGNDVLVYNSPPDSLHPNPAFALGVADYNHNTLDSIGYIQNPAFSTDGTRLIITSDYDKRIYIYHNFPTAPGQMADEIISTQPYNLAAWDNALYDHTFVAAGRNAICVWSNAADLSTPPSQTFNGGIGSAQFSDLKGVALDAHFLYAADRNGKVYIWNGIPANHSVNPVYTLNYGNVHLNRLSSDGTYLCVTQQSPGAIYIYQVADLVAGNTNPWKTISGIGFLNLPSEAITFDGSLAIANQSFNDVLLWPNLNDAPGTSSMVVLGNASNVAFNVPAIGTHQLFMPGALLYENNHLWVGEHKFSSRILRYSCNTTDTHDSAELAMDFRVYPVPAAHELYVSGSYLSAGRDFMLLDLMGRIVKTGKTSGETSMIEVAELAPGMYFLKIAGIREPRKVIKE